MYYSAIVIIVGSSLAQGFIVPDRGRLLHKQAGLCTLGHKIREDSSLPDSPLSHFMERVNGLSYLPSSGIVRNSLQAVREKDADYLVVDEKLEKAIPESKRCMETFPMVGEYRDARDFVKIYRLRQDE